MKGLTLMGPCLRNTQRIRQQIEQTYINHNGILIGTTVSIGIATRQSGKKEHINDLFDRADAALYQAKANGRNCIVSSNDLVLTQ